LLDGVVCKLYLFCFVVDQDEIAARSNQSKKLAGDFCLIPFGVIDVKGNGFSELVYLQWTPGKDDPSKHVLDISSSFSVLNPREEPAVRFSKISRKILKYFPYRRISQFGTQFVQLKLNPQKPNKSYQCKYEKQQ
jgi:hypothetical protein